MDWVICFILIPLFFVYNLCLPGMHFLVMTVLTSLTICDTNNLLHNHIAFYRITLLLVGYVKLIVVKVWLTTISITSFWLKWQVYKSFPNQLLISPPLNPLITIGSYFSQGFLIILLMHTIQYTITSTRNTRFCMSYVQFKGETTLHMATNYELIHNSLQA